MSSRLPAINTSHQIPFSTKNSFIQACGIEPADVVCFVGAGGKTSLMFHLAREAKEQGQKVLVTTTTKIFIPDSDQYDGLDLSGQLFATVAIPGPGMYVGGRPSSIAGKISGVDKDVLAMQRKLFELVLIEADGAAGKPLKGWNATEPVIPEFTTKTIGIVDIQTIGKVVDASFTHRLEIFCALTGAKVGEPLTIDHLYRLVVHPHGLFGKSGGDKVLFINKAESVRDLDHAKKLRALFPDLHSVIGSVHQGCCHA